MIIPKDNIECIIGSFKPDMRFIKAVSLLDNSAYGVFNFQKTKDTSSTIFPEHLELGMKQLGLTAFSSWLSTGQFHSTVDINEFTKYVNGLQGLY